MIAGAVYDFIVVGCGMAGASVAAHLSTRGSVALIEMESQPGRHSTGRSAALFSEIYGNAVIRALSRASRPFLFDTPDGFSPTPLVSPRATLFFGRQDQQAELLAFREDPRIRDATQALDAAATQDLMPLFAPGYLGGGVLDPASADIDVNAMHQGFIRMARANGAHLHLDCAVSSLTRTQGRWRVATRRGDEFDGRVIVNAAGAWADEVAAMAGIGPVGLQPLRRTALLIDVPNDVPSKHWPACIAIDESFYFKPDAGLLFLSPADEHPSAPCDAQPEELDVAIAIDSFMQATGIEVRRVRHKWAGLRVFSADRTPVVGFDPRGDAFFWLGGQGGYGIQSAEALARTAAALACGEPLPADVAAGGVTADQLSPARF
jgi:D-arginine dehydrogenase